jgi:hypothetical protein
MGKADLISSVKKFLDFIDNEFIPKSQKFSIKKPEEMKPRKPPTRKKMEEPKYNITVLEPKKKETKPKPKPKYKVAELDPKPEYNITVLEPKKKQEDIKYTPENRRYNLDKMIKRMSQDGQNYIYGKISLDVLKDKLINPIGKYKRSEINAMKKRITDEEKRLNELLKNNPTIGSEYVNYLDNEIKSKIDKYSDY